MVSLGSAASPARRRRNKLSDRKRQYPRVQRPLHFRGFAGLRQRPARGLRRWIRSRSALAPHRRRARTSHRLDGSKREYLPAPPRCYIRSQNGHNVEIRRSEPIARDLRGAPLPKNRASAESRLRPRPFTFTSARTGQRTFATRSFLTVWSTSFPTRALRP